MKLLCEKYKEEVDPENVSCPHPEDYCKWRQSCIVYFSWKERERSEKKKKERENNDG
ncbi:MAG: hypothetical protein ACLFV2_03850 [Desulfurivibrionaceae bacterium]